MLNLKALKEAAGAIPTTQRQWRFVPWHIVEGPAQIRITTDEDWLLCELPGDTYAKFIALANPSTILSLIERCEELEGALEEAKQANRAWSDAMFQAVTQKG